MKRGLLPIFGLGIWNIVPHPEPQKSNSLAEAKVSLRPCLTPQCRNDFLFACWGLQLKDSDLERGLQAYESYLRHYEEYCTYLPASYPLLENCSHQHFCQAVQFLNRGTRRSCEAAIEPLLPGASRSPEAARACIDFLGKAVLLIDLAEWNSDETLREFVVRTIASDSAEKDKYRIPLSFNSRAFEIVAGMKVIWTRDLLSHLEIGLRDSTIVIFHHMKVLHLYEQSSMKDIFPDNFLDETWRTLSLMLPVADRSCVRWYRSKQRKLGLDGTACEGRHLRASQRNIQDFNFWRDRLIIMREAFDLSQPTGLLQFWRDNRNKVQWWTFWIAIIVFLLTVVGVLESALQVYKAFRPS